jgi:hypothetical protein
MNATLARKLRFSDVVYGIGTTPKSLRLWLQRGLVEIHTPKPAGGGWIEYSFFDIAILALVRTFVNFGVDVPTASRLANSIMRDFFPDVMGVENVEEMPAGVLAVSWSNRRIHLYRAGDEWQLRLVDLWATELARIDGFVADLPSGVSSLRREIEPAPVYLSIDVEAVLRAAFERADESVNEGKDEDE